MSFKKQFGLIFLSIFILIIGVLFTFYHILKNEQQIALAELQRYESYLLADELRQSSDDLTRMARTYTVTKQPRFRNYFNKILDIRDGKHPRPQNYSAIYWDFVTATGLYPSSPSDQQTPLDVLMKQKNFTSDELQLLKQSKNQSDTLVQLETRAMYAMVGLYPNSDGDFVIQNPPDTLMAQNIMHSPEYHLAKKKIMEPMQELFQKVNQRTFDTIQFYRTKGLRLNVLMFALISICLFLIVLSFFLLFLQSLQKKSFSELKKKYSKRHITFILKSWPLLILVSVAFFINLSFFWWNKKIYEEKIHQDISSQLQTIVETTYQSVILWIEAAESELESLALLYQANSTKNLKTNSNFNKSDTLSNFIKVKNYNHYFILNKNFTIISSSESKLLGIKYDAPKALMTQLKEFKKVATLFPTKNQEGEFVNKNILMATYLSNELLIILELPLGGTFSSVVQKGRFKESGESYVFNETTDLLSESRFNDQLYKLQFLKEGQSSSLNILLVDPESKQPTQMIQSAFKKARGVNLIPYNDYRGIPVVGSWIWNSEYKIGFTTEIDANEAFASLNLYNEQAYTQLIISLLLLLILTGVFIWNRALISDVNEKLKSAYHALNIQSHKMEDELNVGRQIQMSMVPVNFPKHKNFSIYAKLEPVRQLGGDFYDFFFLDEDKLCVVIADISGKGVPSALFMAVTKTLIRSASFKYKQTDKILTEVNVNIMLNNPHCMFATVFIAILDLQTGLCEYSNAGHNSSYIKKQNGQLLILSEVHGPVAGAIENTNYQKDQIQLESEDILMAYTDGITEAINNQNELYGEERLEALLKKNSFQSEKELSIQVLNDLDTFSKEARQSDDITLISLKYL